MARHRRRKVGLISDGWESRFPNNSTPYTSTIVFLLGGQGGAAGARLRRAAQRRAHPRAHAELRLGAGESVYVFPKRVRVFVQDYSI